MSRVSSASIVSYVQEYGPCTLQDAATALSAARGDVHFVLFGELKAGRMVREGTAPYWRWSAVTESEGFLAMLEELENA